MKLKKIASLALAGVMAVSMLAGCANKPGTTDDEGTKVEVTTSSIVSALNNGQSADNKAKVTFSDNAEFNAAVAKAFEMAGTSASEDAIAKNIVTVTGKYGTVNGTTADPTTPAEAFTKNGTAAVTGLVVKAYDDAYWTESTMLAAAGRDADAEIAKLTADTRTSTTAQGDDYWIYTYTGNATLVTVTELDGTTTYYVVATVTRTGVKDTVPEV